MNNSLGKIPDLSDCVPFEDNLGRSNRFEEKVTGFEGYVRLDNEDHGKSKVLEGRMIKRADASDNLKGMVKVELEKTKELKKKCIIV